MFKKIVHIILVGLPLFCLSQNKQASDSANTREVDNLYKNYRLAKDDSSQLMSLDRLGFYYQRINVDSSLKYFHAALDLSRQKSIPWAEARILAGLSGLMEHQGKYAEAFELLFTSLKIAEDNNSVYDIARANRRISGLYFEMQNYPKAIAYLLKALQLDEAGHLPDKVAIDHYALANAYENMNSLDSAVFHVDFALQHKDLLKTLMQTVYSIDGHIKQKKGNYEQAMLSYRKAMQEARSINDLIGSSLVCSDFSALYETRNSKDSAIIYALRGFNYAKEISYKKGVMLNSRLLAALYDSVQPSLALHYYKIAVAAKDSLFGANSMQSVQDLLSREETRRKELEDTKTAFRNKLRVYGLLAGLAVLLIIAFILYRNNRQKQKANVVLQQQKTKIETTLDELKSTQAQLIQSEKMASLGQLTAGIAHEIQNPLNFVNNFSEINNELIDEVKRETGNGKNENVQDLLNDIFQNNEKITLHGKRADAIVKGMLEHSRQGTGQKQLTDINVLADEYLKLAYHGMLAKNKEFNVTMQTDFDKSISKINIIPSDISRVLLNIYNNAFYAVNEKQQSGIVGYAPLVSVSTKKQGDKVVISIKDNGNGIPQNIIDKIFQPFFTTKPTGQGTGLGLSLAYDIVKAHNGEIKVNNVETGGAVFTILLPSS